MDEPSASNTELGLPFSSVMLTLRISTVRSPLCGMCRLGMSPACWPSGASIPCFLLPGLKWPPAEVKGGSHLPTACTWIACSPGGRPLTETLISTPCAVWVRLTEPTSLPSLPFIGALAVCAAAGRAALRSRMVTKTGLRNIIRSLLLKRRKTALNIGGIADFTVGGNLCRDIQRPGARNGANQLLCRCYGRRASAAPDRLGLSLRRQAVKRARPG